jgi:hypothetical protein
MTANEPGKGFAMNRLSPGQPYRSWQGLPSLAGLATMERATSCLWSVEESVTRLKRLHYVLKRLHEILTARITAEPVYELKMAYSHHAWLCAEQVTAIRKRVGEMREPPLGLEHVPHAGLERLLDEILAAPGTEWLLAGVYQVAIPAVLESVRRLERDAHPLADAPTVRLARLTGFELDGIARYGETALACLVGPPEQEAMKAWVALLGECLRSAGGLDGTLAADACPLPGPQFSATPWQYHGAPVRDSRFQDSYNAGVNPEAFLYDPQFRARDKTLMMFYKRFRELDVPEMMASILWELRDEEPWEFHAEMSRQLWDEARHAMMGEAGFVAAGIDWTRIPVNFTWSRNLNLQLNARERHGVLYFIEQGLMPRNGKRFEWEVGQESGDGLSALFQDFDWADEVLHAQIGRRWYVPRFASVREALGYGDRCWSRVLSHWHDYRAQGLTEHRNWWPELYAEACSRWGLEPDPAALTFATSYESVRADLKSIETGSDQ